MYNDVTKIKNKPTLTRLPFYAALFLIILLQGFQDTLGKRVEHTVTCPVADDEIIGKRCDVFNVQEQDVFTLFVLQGFDNFMCKFECVQISPLFMVYHGEIYRLSRCSVWTISLMARNTVECIPSRLVSIHFYTDVQS